MDMTLYKIKDLLDRRSDAVIRDLFAEFRAEYPNPDAVDIENFAFDVMQVQKEKRKIYRAVDGFFGPKTKAELSMRMGDVEEMARVLREVKLAKAEAEAKAKAQICAAEARSKGI